MRCWYPARLLCAWGPLSIERRTMTRHRKGRKVLSPGLRWRLEGGCDSLGAAAYAFLRGAGVAQDKTRGARLFAELCFRGQADSCHVLGLIYEYGEGLPANPAFGRVLLARACDAGEQEACAHIGRLDQSSESD
ncbi:MAG: tetratricopeptide repeat protein [Paracoccaceae bacterium]